MAQVLSIENQLLLKTILDRKPESLKELEAATGRSSSNLSRTLKTMARYDPLLQAPGRPGKDRRRRRQARAVLVAAPLSLGRFALHGAHPALV